MVHSILGAALVLAAGLGPQDTEEARVQTFLDAFVKAMIAKDGAAINRCFHLRRMVQELETRGVQFGLADPEAREKVLQAALPKIGAAAGMLGVGWEKIRLLRLKPKPDGPEAEAFCRLTLTGGSRSKIRFWLVKADDAWKIYDLEMQEENMRLSVTLGAVYATMAGDDKSRRAVMMAFMTLQKALQQLGAGEAEEANKTLQKAIDAEPPVLVRAWLELVNAQTLQVLGRHEEAVKSADRVLELQKDIVVAHHLKAAAYFELEEFEKCIACEKEFMKAVGDDAEAWEVIGNAYDKLKKRDDAIEAYRKGAASDDEEHSNRMSLARLLLAAGKPGEAAPVLLQAVRNAKDEDIFQEAADLLDGQGTPEGLLALAEDELTRSPDDGSVRRWQGRALRKLKRYEESEKVLRAAIANDKEDTASADELVLTLVHSGKDKEAMALVDGMSAEREERAHFLRAYVHAVADRPAKAVEELARFLDGDEDAEVMLEEVENEAVFKKARESAEFKSLAERTKARSEYTRATDTLVEKEDWDGLLKLSKERAGAAPDHAHAHYNQGRALRRLGRLLDAEIALKAAIAKSKLKPKYFEELGKALAAQGRLDEALALADDFQSKGQNKDHALFMRVAFYAMVKKSGPAIKALEELLKEKSYWWSVVEEDADLEEFRKLQGVQDLLKKAKSEE